MYTKVDMKMPCCIIMGNEEEGISAEYIKLSDAKAKLPMKGTIGSLNVSVACGVILYEVLRQRA
jgi:23S rRNA (guanosine2251-2'-O)-methyltransferase